MLFILKAHDVLSSLLTHMSEKGSKEVCAVWKDSVLYSRPSADHFRTYKAIKMVVNQASQARFTIFMVNYGT